MDDDVKQMFDEAVRQIREIAVDVGRVIAQRQASYLQSVEALKAAQTRLAELSTPPDDPMTAMQSQLMTLAEAIRAGQNGKKVITTPSGETYIAQSIPE